MKNGGGSIIEGYHLKGSESGVKLHYCIPKILYYKKSWLGECGYVIAARVLCYILIY
jgi:hypothetical protein